jgi:uncharacterized protein
VRTLAPAVWLCIGAVLLQVCEPAAAARSYPEMTRRVVDSYVIPRFATLRSATEALHKDLQATCSGDPGRLDAARADFEATVQAWAQVEFLRFGPMAVIGRPERFSFWPDPRRVMQRQLRRLIARRDASALDAASLAKKSAAIQGLPALEALMWDEKHPLGGDREDQVYRCRLAIAIAANLSGLARDLLAEWKGESGWRRRMLDAGPQNVSYKSETEPPAEFARALITGLRMLQERQVVPLMEAEAKPGKTPRLPFARSKLSAAYLKASIASAQALYEAMQLADDVPRDKVWMPRWITGAFERLAQDGPAAVRLKPVKETDPERERTLRFMRFHVEGIRKLVGRELAPLAGLMIGFNELDGD